MSRKLRILFVVQHGALLRFALLIPALAERGHEIHIAFPPGGDWKGSETSDPPQRTLDLLGELQARFPGSIEYGPVPARPRGGWSDTAWLVRGLADLAHNANPRYKKASVLRKRTKQRVLGRMEKGNEFEPLGRALAVRVGSKLAKRTDADLSRKVLGVTAALEDAVPSQPEIDRFVRELAPDVVVVTGTFRHVSSEVELLKSARALGIPAGIFVTSWDNLTNKGSLKFVPERVFVWNEIQARGRGRAAPDPARPGAGDRRARLRRVVRAHADADARAAAASSSGSTRRSRTSSTSAPARNVARNEAEFVQRWVAALRASERRAAAELNIVVRPHPNVRDRRTRDVGDRQRVVVWPPRGRVPGRGQARATTSSTRSPTARPSSA